MLHSPGKSAAAASRAAGTAKLTAAFCAIAGAATNDRATANPSRTSPASGGSAMRDGGYVRLPAAGEPPIGLTTPMADNLPPYGHQTADRHQPPEIVSPLPPRRH